MGEDHVAGMSSLTSMPDNAGGADMVDGLVTDPTLFPSWANPGDQIFRWTDDQGTEYFVTASVFRLLNQPWRGQKNVTVDAKPAVKAALRLCKDVPVLKFNTNFETRCPAIADVSTKIVLASNNKQISVYQAGKINSTKLTGALLKHNDVSNEVIH